MSKQQFRVVNKEVFLGDDKIGFFNDPDNHYQATRGNAEHREAFLKWHAEQQEEESPAAEVETGFDLSQTEPYGAQVEPETGDETPHETKGGEETEQPEQKVDVVLKENWNEPIEDAPKPKPDGPEYHEVPEIEPIVRPGYGINAPEYLRWAWNQPDEVFLGIYKISKEDFRAEHGKYLDSVLIKSEKGGF